MDHVFLYHKLEKAENIGSIIRNLTTFKQIFLYDEQPRQNITTRAEKVSLSKKYPSNPTNYEYRISNLERVLEEYSSKGYDFVVAETEDWLPEIERIKGKSLPDISRNTVFVFGKEGKGLPRDLGWSDKFKCRVLTIGKHSQNVATIAARVDTLLRFSDL